MKRILHSPDTSGGAPLPFGGLPQPTFQDKALTVENVYPDGNPSPTFRDRGSQRHMAAHLGKRLIPDPSTPETTWVEMPDGIVTRRRLQLGEWLITPKNALRATLLGLGLLNVGYNADALAHNIPSAATDIGDEAQQAWFRMQHGDGTPDQTTVYPGKAGQKISYRHFEITSNNTVGQSASAANKVKDILEKAVPLDGKITELMVRGGASDDFRTDRRLTVPDTGNGNLADRRAKALLKDVKQAAESLGLELPKATVTGSENLLSSQEYDTLTKFAKKAGYSDAQAAIVAADRGAKLPGKLGTMVDELIAKARGAHVEGTVKVVTDFKLPDHVETIPGIHPPENPVRDYEDLRFLPFFVPPLRRLRLAEQQIPKTKLVEFSNEVADPVWVRLYKEALTQDERLKTEAAFYTRKLTHLLRDDRISSIDRMDYSAMDGSERSIRVCFVDHEPTDETREMFRQILSTTVNMNEGALSDAVSTIMVYPSENAGLAHGDPKRIGLGIDKQDDVSILGTTTPLLGLIEMHMPPEPSPDTLHDYMSPAWILAHELGHAMDVDPSKPNELQPTADGRYVSVSTWRDAAKPIHGSMRPLPVAPDSERISYRIKRQVVDKDGNVIPRIETVTQGDDKIPEATASQIVDAHPTQYGSSRSSEHFGEGFAGALLHTLYGTEIPYSQTGRDEPQLPVGNFAKGYTPARQTIETVIDATGVDLGRPIKTHSGEIRFTTTTVEQDQRLFAIATRARQTATPNESDMIAVLGWVIK